MISQEKPLIPSNMPVMFRTMSDYTAIDVVVKANSTNMLTINLG